MTEPINFLQINRYWFLTWTTYGTWLPGDQRGFVGVAPNEFGRMVEHNQPGTPLAPPRPGLRRSTETRMNGTRNSPGADATRLAGNYRNCYVFEPKRRKISAAPYRDRIVHHAVVGVLEPIYERRTGGPPVPRNLGEGAPWPRK